MNQGAGLSWERGDSGSLGKGVTISFLCSYVAEGKWKRAGSQLYKLQIIEVESYFAV
jgi:hypothetical protein